MNNKHTESIKDEESKIEEHSIVLDEAIIKCREPYDLDYIMTKKDLSLGNVVELRSGRIYIIASSHSGNLLISLNDGTYINIKIYNDDLTSKINNKLDIVKVYKDFTFKEILWERKEKLHLTDDEIIILRNIDKRFKYIARNGDNRLCLYEKIPTKIRYVWMIDNIYEKIIDFSMYSHLFKLIKCTDEKPYLIEDLLNGDKNDINN